MKKCWVGINNHPWVWEKCTTWFKFMSTLEIVQKEKEMGDRKYSPFSVGWGLEVQSLEIHEVLHSCTGP